MEYELEEYGYIDTHDMLYDSAGALNQYCGFLSTINRKMHIYEVVLVII